MEYVVSFLKRKKDPEKNSKVERKKGGRRAARGKNPPGKD